MEIKNIVFDFGGVLIDWNPLYLFDDKFTDKKELQFFLENVCTTTWNQDLDKGYPFESGVNDLILKFPEFTKEIKLFHTNWDEMIKSDIPENSSLLDNLKENYKLYGLTNWSSETLPILYNRFSFFKYFKGVVVSGEEKICKPDVEIYTILTDRYNLKPKQSVFIDDNLTNVQAAEILGFKVVHVKKTTNLKEELKKLGVVFQ
ncbi:HAD family phosphatase [Flammeovirga pectinis]|uniref:HAD family phosphatase n=1 Tax=Flammeovirga pectinis TaxID=2494373 RepID=A0A3S9P400_9BACT|nr:HAD family phosphatase [Flammeovirga pectinis]AZQ62947.1 HAD family phosphatase [Flammeovirga pectinis]